MSSQLRNNGLSLVMIALFLVFLGGHAATGFVDQNNDRQQHGQPPNTFGTNLTTGNFWESVFENWESEFLQMAAYVGLTAILADTDQRACRR